MPRLPIARYLVALLLLPVASVAQDEEISTITVTATRLEQTLNSVPASITVVSGANIQHARQQLGLDEALAKVPGMFMQNRFNFSQDLRIAIRGFGSRSNFGVRGIKILVDDIPETLADGQSQVDSIDLGSVRQVEVLRGPASAIHGNAAGGVINIQSENGAAEPYVEGRVAAGEYGYRKQQLKAAGTHGRADYLFSVSDLRIDGYREQSAARNTQLNSRFRFRPDADSEWSLTFSATDQPESDDAGGVSIDNARNKPRLAYGPNLSFDAGEELEQQKIGIKYTRETASGGTFTARNYYLQRDFSNRLPFAAGGIVTFDRFFAGGGASYVQPFQLGRFQHRLVVGADYDRQDDDRQRFDNNAGVQGARTLWQNERVTGGGVFVLDSIAVTDRLDISLGARYDRLDFDVSDEFLSDGDDSGSRSVNDLSPSLGFVYAFANETAVYGNVSTAFETPTSTEFANPDGSGGFNPDLGPQQSRGYELGVRGVISAIARYEVALFSISVDDELIPFEIASSPGRDYYVNAGRSSRRGLELALNAEPVAGLNLSLAYTWSQFEFDEFIDENGTDFSGNAIPGIPRTFAHVDISYLRDSGLFIAVDAMYADRMFANNANSAFVDGAAIANLRVGWRRSIGDIEVEPFAGINNLSDEPYTANVRINAFGGRYFEPGPERNAYAGFSVRYRFAE